MCGICGIFNQNGSRVSSQLVDGMVDAIRHRGPDAKGIYAHDQVGLGLARLSIIDLQGGAQPMHNRDRSVWITFNGEIFNYIELRKQLINKGHVFVTSSDTEVLLKLYEEEGERCVDHLNGQWAFAIWDARQKSLFLSRDRLGVRPLYYCQCGASFLFASEIKALFTHPDVPRELDWTGLQQTFTFWHTLPPRTAFRGISELAPGHSLIVRAQSIEIKPHWELDFRPDPDASLDEMERASKLAELLLDATRIRLRADVPVGAYLSGGLDSSLITALILRASSSPLETFSVAFDDPQYDESEYQNQVVAHLGTRHHVVRCTHEDIGQAFADLIHHSEKPVLRTAPVPMFLLARLVRQSGFKVVLTGEGSDEIMGGYDIFKETKIRAFCAAQPSSRMRPHILRRLYPYLPQIQSQRTEFLKMFFRIRPEDLDSPFFSHLPRWETTNRLELLFTPEVRAHWTQQPPWIAIEDELPNAYSSWDHFQRAQFLETAYLLPGYILSSQGDRPAMAHAVEGRYPFLDHRVVEFASSLPSTMKMRGLKEKHILKTVAQGLIPESIVQRHKQPYRAPDVHAFLDSRNGQPRFDYVAELLSPDCLRRFGVFHASAVQALLERLTKNLDRPSVRDSMALTGVISTQLLIHYFVQNPRRGNEQHTRDFASVHQ